MLERAEEAFAFPATVWQQLVFGGFAWGPERAVKRRRSLLVLSGLPVIPFNRDHAMRAAQVAAQMPTAQIGFADFQIAATALVDGAELLTFNRAHFGRVAGLQLAAV